MISLRTSSWILLTLILATVPVMIQAKLEKLNPSKLKKLVEEDGPAMVLFFARWCKYSRPFLPVFLAASHVLEDVFPGVRFAQINAFKYAEFLGDYYEIGKYPTIWFIQNHTYYDFNGNRTIKAIRQFISEHLRR